MKRTIVPITAMYLAVTAAMCIPAQAAEEDTTFAYVSSKGQLDDESTYWQSADVSEGSGSATVTVNNSQKKQVFRGFAGCFNEAGWEMLKMLPQADRDRAMKLLFSKENGLGLEWGRIPIGASDYALSRYSLDDATTDDLNMDHFSIARDKDTLIQYIKWAQAVNPKLKFWASPWTPPPWMKSNTISDPRGKGYDGGVMRNEPNVFKAHALYFSKFIQAYGAEGIKINAICPQNEPGYLREYPTCGWGKYNDYDGKDVNGAEYLSTFVADYLDPKLKEDNLATEIWFGTLSNNKTFSGYWGGMKTKLGTKAHDVIKGLGFQWNNSDSVAPNIKDGYFVFCSEHQCGNYYWNGSKATSRNDANDQNFLESMAPNNHAYGEESWGLIARWIKNGTNLYSAWNMVLDETGFNLNWKQKWPQNALLFVNRSTKKLVATPYYYMMRHIGQYVDSGAVLLGSTGDDALAFQNPNGGFVVAISNTGNAKDMTVSVGGKSYKFKHPGKGWATLYVGPKPVSVKNCLRQGYVAQKSGGLKITAMNNGLKVSLSSQAAGHIEVLTLSGRVLDSRAIPLGSSEITLPHQSHSGMLLVRVTNGNQVSTARIMNAL